MPANTNVPTIRFSQTLKAAIYSRTSASDQSYKDREPELVTCCRGRGWEPTPFRDDRSLLAGSRPGLELLLDAVRRRKVKAVVCAKLTDLAGSLAQFAVLYEELKTHQVGLVCIDQGIDTVTEKGEAPNPASRLFYGLLSAVLKFGRNRAREGTRNGLKAARAQGSRDKDDIQRRYTPPKDTHRREREVIPVRLRQRHAGHPQDVLPRSHIKRTRRSDKRVARSSGWSYTWMRRKPPVHPVGVTVRQVAAVGLSSRRARTWSRPRPKSPRRPGSVLRPRRRE
jgi:DNA invertase Pin-like site-specific DNA recombinase